MQEIQNAINTTTAGIVTTPAAAPIANATHHRRHQDHPEHIITILAAVALAIAFIINIHHLSLPSSLS